jgi:hypothetical protein
MDKSDGVRWDKPYCSTGSDTQNPLVLVLYPMTHTFMQEKIDTFFGGEWTGERRIHGLKGGARAYLLSLLAAKTNRPILLIAPTTREAEVLYQDLVFFLGEE